MKPTVIFAGVFGWALVSHTVVAEEVRHSAVAPVIDGKIEAVWGQAEWRDMSHHITGSVPEPTDFSGRYKLLWDQDHLYVMAEITDDVLYDRHPDPREAYWDDDCLEIFIDADASGGNHLYTHNAFAYHVALDGHVADMGAQRPEGDAEILLLDDHAISRWRRSAENPDVIVWEVAVRLYGDTFDPALDTSEPLKLEVGKKIGFMLAYCDNDGSETREHFMGSHAIEPVDGDKNLGYITADVFGKLTLVP
ncbi:sugar-binding protein [Kordiimonas sp.]|uniref:sugar-binding protein n=1 Tax=Kordiimonas sp. TaxID=1970157 RepID=UPI003A94949B